MSDITEIQDTTTLQESAFQGASVCPSCANIGEFDLPMDQGLFQIACYDCDHIYEIDAAEALAAAQMRDMTDSVAANDDTPSLQSTDEGDIAAQSAPERFDDIDINTPTRFDLPPVTPSAKTGRTSIILVSILSLGLFMTAAMVALGLYFLTLRTDSDLSRYIEANILQLTPAKFEVQTASYEMSETALGQSLLVTITINNSGQVEGAPEEMQIVLVDAQNEAIISWPLDTAGQIIAPGQSTQLYTRLFEPPEEFANLRVMVR